MNSMFLKLGKNDFVKGLIVTVIGSALGVIYPAISAGTVVDMSVLKGAGMAGVTAGLAYLSKNLFTNSAGTIGPEKDPNAPKG